MCIVGVLYLLFEHSILGRPRTTEEASGKGFGRVVIGLQVSHDRDKFSPDECDGLKTML